MSRVDARDTSSGFRVSQHIGKHYIYVRSFTDRHDAQVTYRKNAIVGGIATVALALGAAEAVNLNFDDLFHPAALTECFTSMAPVSHDLGTAAVGTALGIGAGATGFQTYRSLKRFFATR